MTDTYTVGIHEKEADYSLFITATAPDNKTFYTAVAETLVANVVGAFSIADILYDLKRDVTVTGVHVDTYPKSDHTIHEFDEDSDTMTLVDKDDLTVKHTFDLFVWAKRYGVS